MTRLISSVYDQGPSPAPIGREAQRRNIEACRKLWHNHGLATINPADIEDDWTRQAIINIAEQAYGKRGQK